MGLFTTTTRKVAAGAVAGLALVGGGTAAWAATATSASATSAVPAAKPAAAHRAHGLLARTDHATIELKQKGTWVTVTYDRGKVTASSATSVTIARPDGESVSIALTSATHYRGISAATQLQTGKSALVLSEHGQAIRVRQALPKS